MMKANWSCFSLLWQRAPVAFIVAFDNAGKSKLARMAMMAMTTSSSMSVKPKRSSAQAFAVGALNWSIFISLVVGFAPHLCVVPQVLASVFFCAHQSKRWENTFAPKHQKSRANTGSTGSNPNVFVPKGRVIGDEFAHHPDAFLVLNHIHPHTLRTHIFLRPFESDVFTHDPVRNGVEQDRAAAHRAGRRGRRYRVESGCFDCMIRLNRSSLALETYTSLFIMKTPSLIYRILITVGVILS